MYPTQRFAQRFFSAKRGVFATMMAEFQHETVLDFGLCKSLLLGTRLEGQDVRPKVSAIMSGVFVVFCLQKRYFALPTSHLVYSPSSSPELLTNVFEVTSLLTPSLMAIAFTVAVFVRVMASLYRALALVGALPSVV